LQIDAVVLAASPNTGRLATESDEAFEANIDILGKPMLSYILSVLKNVPEIQNIILVGPADHLSDFLNESIKIVEPGEDLISNVKIGVSQTQSEHILVVCSDIPLVTEEILKDFLDAAISSGADFVYPVSTEEDCVSKYPGVERTYVKIKGVKYTGGNLFYIKERCIENLWETIDILYGYRKSPVKMGLYFGLGFALKVLLGIAGLPEIEEHVGKITGMKCKAYVAPPEIGIDVDKPKDLELVRAVLSK